MDKIEELDQIKLIKSIKSQGAYLESGLIGTVVCCFPKGYEIKFQGIAQTFDVDAKYVQKYIEPEIVPEEETDY